MTATPNLEAYITVILQLASLGLLFSLSLTPAAPLVVATPAPQVVSSVEGEKKVETEVEISTPVTTTSVKTEVKAKDYGPITDSINVKKYVRDYFADIPLLARIAECESHNRQYDKSGAVIRGEVNTMDVGVMQINELYHLDTSKKLGYDIYTIEGNVAYARYLYEKQGAKPWISSSACWAKFSESEIALR